jgi:hypothetical protein
MKSNLKTSVRKVSCASLSRHDRYLAVNRFKNISGVTEITATVTHCLSWPAHWQTLSCHFHIMPRAEIMWGQIQWPRRPCVLFSAVDGWVKSHLLTSEIIKYEAPRSLLVELRLVYRVWIYWAASQLREQTTATVDNRQPKGRLKCIIGYISAIPRKKCIWKLTDSHL